MDVKKIVWIVFGLMVFSSNAQALGCVVDYRAMRVKTVEKWFGRVEQPEFKSGTLSGEGKSEPSCVRNALRGVERNGWKLTYKRIKRITRSRR